VHLLSLVAVDALVAVPVVIWAVAMRLFWKRRKGPFPPKPRGPRSSHGAPE